ncbi:pectin lyase fold/virulence factor [Phlyctochytrium arcticum]|nr:pectin lyase fold/virulence factor [Phlyctochytrium arcticum]
MARNNNYGPYLGVQQSERSLVRVQADSEILLENFNAIDHELDMGFDLALATGAKFTFRNGNIKNLTARHCAKLSYGSISIEGSTIENSNCTYVLAKVQLNRSTLTFQNSTLKNSTCVDGATLFDVSGSSLIINNTLVEGTRSPRGAVFIARDAAEFVFTNSALSNSYAYRSLISIDISSTVKISNSAVKSNTAQFRDLILIDSHGGNTVLNNNTFEDNTSVQESFIKISPGVNLVLSNSTFHRNRKPLSIDSLSAISIEKCMFTQNSAVINSRGNTTVKDSTFRHNIAATDSGGAIAHVPGHTSAFLVISNTVFDTNVADIDGGAIFLDSPKFDPIKLVNVTFKGNSAKRGGAMFQAQSQWANKGLGGYASSAFEGNTAEWQGS